MFARHEDGGHGRSTHSFSAYDGAARRLRSGRLLKSLVRWVAFAAAASWVPVGAGATQPSQVPSYPFIQYAGVCATKIVFTYGGDLWIADRNGSQARRLTVQPGEKRNPRFSPDGRFVAYTLTEAGRRGDIYVIPTAGGAARRITYHSADDVMLDWTADGRQLLFASNQASERDRYRQLYLVDRDGGLPRKLPAPYGETAALSPDGHTLFFTTTPDFQEEAWKRYLGGRAPNIWRMDLRSLAAARIVPSDAPQSVPMLRGDTVYFLSEAGPDQRSNLFAWREGSSARQLTHFTDVDVRFPAIGGDAIVFNVGGRLEVLDLNTEKVEAIALDIHQQDLRAQIERRSVGSEVANMALNSDGGKAAFESHGDLFVMDLASGITSNITRTPGAAERNPVFAGNSGTLFYTSDASGEYALMATEASGGEPRVVQRGAPGFITSVIPAPQGSWVAFTDDAMRLFVLNTRTRQKKLLDTFRWRETESTDASRGPASWSADGRYLVYGRDLPNRNSAVVIFDTESGESRQITSGFYSDFAPLFSADGRYLFTLSYRRLTPTFGDVDSTWTYAGSASLSVIALTAGAPPPGNEGWKPSAAALPKYSAPWDLEGAEKRLAALNVPAGDISALQLVGHDLLYLRRDGQTANLWRFDLESLKETKSLDNVSDYVASANGAILARRDQTIVSAKVEGGSETALDLKDLRTDIVQAEENRQVLREAWRLERDRFYDPGMHGRDWDGILTHYLSMAENAVTRSDMTFVVREMVAELGAGHTGAYPMPRDQMNAHADDVGMLGVDFAQRDGHYVIAHIIVPGARAAELRSPLADAGGGVREGDYLLAVNDEPVGIDRAPWAPFQGLADKEVELTVNAQPTLIGARKVRVKTLRSEAMLRELDWVERNRQYVLAASGGRIGYLYVRDTGDSGQNQLELQYKAQHDLDGLIVDARFNAGGALADRFVELLNRPPLVYFNRRYGGDYPLPEQASGPKAFLTNGWSYSGGDGFPLLFKAAKAGPVIGTRTAGGLIGPNGYFQLMDGIIISVAPQRVYSNDGIWPNGNNGVTPDIEVLNDPGVLAQGHDQQLDAAIEYVKSRLSGANKVPAPKIEFQRKPGTGG